MIEENITNNPLDGLKVSEEKLEQPKEVNIEDAVVEPTPVPTPTKPKKKISKKKVLIVVIIIIGILGIMVGGYLFSKQITFKSYELGYTQGVVDVAVRQTTTGNITYAFSENNSTSLDEININELCDN